MLKVISIIVYLFIYLFAGCKQVKVDYDPSGQVCITTSQDKFVRLYDLENGTLIAKVILLFKFYCNTPNLIVRLLVTAML